MRWRIFAGGAPAAAVEPTSACFAPHAALYLDPLGSVRSCCATGFELGKVTGPDRQTLQEIWEGRQVAAQRRALDGGSFDLGCRGCGQDIEAGGRRAALAFHFDRWSAGAPHRSPQHLDLALSNRCNLRCTMCNGGLSSSIRAQREHLPPLPPAYDDAFFDELEGWLPHVRRLHFKGGEPFLARENRRIWDFLLAQGLHPEVVVTTNGTVYDNRVARYVRDLAMHPIVSVDAMAADVLQSIRLGVDAVTLWRNVDRFQALADAAGNGMTLTFCVMAANWRESLPFLQEVDRRGVNANLVYVDQPHDHDLFRLPHDQLVEVLGDLAARPTDWHHQEPARAWSELLDRLRRRVEHPVQVGRRAAPPSAAALAADIAPLGRPAAAGTAKHLASTQDLPPIELELRVGRVTRVHAPPWARWLAPEAWQGRSMTDLATAIEADVGPLFATPLPSDVAGVESWALRIEASDGRRSLRAHAFTEPAGAQQVLLFLQPPAGDGPAEAADR